MNKKFDCVEMKNEIQRKLQAEYEGLTLEERKKKIDTELSASPILGPMYRRLLAKRTDDAALKVAEEPGRYKTGK
jgi:hypothetical protein